MAIAAGQAARIGRQRRGAHGCRTQRNIAEQYRRIQTVVARAKDIARRPARQRAGGGGAAGQPVLCAVRIIDRENHRRAGEIAGIKPGGPWRPVQREIPSQRPGAGIEAVCVLQLGGGQRLAARAAGQTRGGAVPETAQDHPAIEVEAQRRQIWQIGKSVPGRQRLLSADQPAERGAARSGHAVGAGGIAIGDATQGAVLHPDQPAQGDRAIRGDVDVAMGMGIGDLSGRGADQPARHDLDPDTVGEAQVPQRHRPVDDPVVITNEPTPGQRWRPVNIAVIAIDSYVGDTVLNGADVIADQPPHRIAIAQNCALHPGVADRAQILRRQHPAPIERNFGIGHAQISDQRGIGQFIEHPARVIIAVHHQPVDRVAIAIQRACEAVDRRKSRQALAVAVPVGGAAGVDVIHQNEARRHQIVRGDALHAVNIGQLIGIGVAAIAAERAQEIAAAGIDREISGIEGGEAAANLLPAAIGHGEIADIDTAQCAGGHRAIGVEIETAILRDDRCVQHDIVVSPKAQLIGRGPGQRLIDGDIARIRAAGVGVQRDIARLQIGHQRRRRHRAGDGDIRRVQQQGAGFACGRPQIGQTGVAQILMAGDFGKAAIPAIGAAPRRDLPRHIGQDLGPQDHPAAVARAAAIGADPGGGIDGQRIGGHQIAAALIIAADADAAARAARQPVGAERGTAERNGLTGDRDVAARGGARRTAGRRRNIHPPRDPHRPARAAAEHDGARLPADALRRNHAGHVDRLARGLPRGGGLQLDPATIGDDAPGIADRGAGVIARGQRHLQKSIPGQVERGAFARAEPHPAHRHRDRARILDRAAQKRGIAAGEDADRPGIADACAAATARKAEPPVQEIGVADGQGRGDETAGVHRAIRADGDAVGVDDKDLTIAAQAAVDLGAGRAGHSVQDRRSGARLDIGHRIAGADRIIAPVHHRAVGALGHHHRPCRGGGNADIALGDHPALRQDHRLRRDRQR